MSRVSSHLLNLKIYVASPYGFCEAGRYFSKNYLIPKLSKYNYTVLDPWRPLSGYEQNDIINASKKLSLEDAMRIAESNESMLRKSNIVLAFLDGPDVDSGVSAEIGYAYALGKKILGYRGDFRTCSDCPSCIVNLQVEAFIRKSGGDIYSDLDALISELNRVGTS